MAGHKSPKAKEDKAKKRKRQASEGDSKSERHRPQHQERQSELALESGKLSRRDANQDVAPWGSNRPSDDCGATWRISKPMGGRMLDIDPILTADEQHLILIYNTSIQVYKAKNSLLVRRIPICALDSASQVSISTAIVAVRQSKQSPDFVWVACSDGQVYHVEWTTASKVIPSFRTVSGTAKAMTIVPVIAEQETRDIVLIAESNRRNRMEVMAYQKKRRSSLQSKKLVVLEKPGQGLQLLEASEDGQVLVGAFHDGLFLGAMSTSDSCELEQLRYEVFSFDAPDLITTLDLRHYARPASNRGRDREHEAGSDTIVDVIAGGSRGGIYVYRDALSRVQAVGKPQNAKDGVQVQKFHWHRKAVHSVKWSRDGNYFISGGSENVLVIWQVDTSKRDYLPHLSGSVENIVVSASGASYVLHLDDNSAMIISTAELKPITYVSGIQSATIDVATPKDSLVKRVWSVVENVRRPIPAAIRSSDPSKLHVCVGNGRQATMSGDFSAPLLQTFDLEFFTSVSKQALARTHPTDVNLNNKGHAIDEPLVSHIAFSHDGKWLASVDEWRPSTRDVEAVRTDVQTQLVRDRHEVYLKFWQVDDGNEFMALVSRINAPHSTSHPEVVLDLASDPTAACFASIGGDGRVRVWRPKTRLQNGIPVKSDSGQDAVHWSCSQVIAVGEPSSREIGAELSNSATSPKPQGRLAFSEDGSTLFAAFGIADAGVVYVIETTSGQVVKILDGLWEGELHTVRALSSFVVVLSDELRVYDVVSDELRYGLVVPKIPGAHELLQLAVDRQSGRFAVALPIGDFSSVGVFDPEDSEPLLVRSIPQRIVSLVSAPATSGFIVLDDIAQIWVIAEGSDPTALSTMQPLQDLRLDDAGSTAKEIIADVDDVEMDSGDEIDQGERDEDVDMDDYTAPIVVVQQRLAAVFDAAPAFAAPPVEDLFYKVAELLTVKPLPTVSA